MADSNDASFDSNATLDYKFRPKTYWEGPERLLANIKGVARRRAIKEALEAGELERIPARFFAESLDPVEKSALGRIDPSLWGGEFLPDCEEDEVEIARISFPYSALGDVFSLRARPVKGEIHYRMEDDNVGRRWLVDPKQSARPLTLKQVGYLLLGACEEDDPGSYVQEKWEEDHHEFGESPETCTSAIEFSSEFYPELGAFYEEEAALWRAGQAQQYE